MSHNGLSIYAVAVLKHEPSKYAMPLAIFIVFCKFNLFGQNMANMADKMRKSSKLARCHTLLWDGFLLSNQMN